MSRTLAFLLFLLPSFAFARGGGGCVLEGTFVSTSRGPVLVQSLRPGDEVLALSSTRGLRSSKVLNVVSFESEQVLQVRTNRGDLSVTPEHPLAVGAGEYRFAGALRAGDNLLAFGGEAEIQGIESLPGKRRVYNVITTWPSTFSAAGLWVHNKGCFLPDTPILLADGTERPIGELREGDRVRAFTPEGRLAPASVQRIFSLQVDHYYELRTRGGRLVRATPEHPFYVGEGAFRTVERLREGDSVVVVGANGLAEDIVESLTRVSEPVEVYNLQTDDPHTFIASSFAVHNKGGGGGGGGFGRSSGSRSSWYRSHTYRDDSCVSTADPEYPYRCQHRTPWWLEAIILLSVAGFIGIMRTQQGRGGEGGGEYMHPPSAYVPKIEQTKKELAAALTRNPNFRREDILTAAQKAFMTLQECWERRDYSTMAPLAGSSLRKTHEAQIQSMRRNREINRIRDIKLEVLEVVNFQGQGNWMNATVLIQARMVDFYEDGGSGRMIRGSKSPSAFQEFWVFAKTGGRWLLQEIEQARESSALSEENRLEGGFEAAAKRFSPFLPKPEQKIEEFSRLDPDWAIAGLRALARSSAMSFFLCFEKGDTSLIEEIATPEFQLRFRNALEEMKSRGAHAEYRNICVRGVTFLSAINEPGQKEFGVEVSLHAQRTVVRDGETKLNDGDVVPFQERFFFRKEGAEFKLFDSGQGAEAKAG